MQLDHFLEDRSFNELRVVLRPGAGVGHHCRGLPCHAREAVRCGDPRSGLCRAVQRFRPAEISHRSSLRISRITVDPPISSALAFPSSVWMFIKGAARSAVATSGARRSPTFDKASAQLLAFNSGNLTLAPLRAVLACGLVSDS